MLILGPKKGGPMGGSMSDEDKDIGGDPKEEAGQAVLDAMKGSDPMELVTSLEALMELCYPSLTPAGGESDYAEGSGEEEP